MNDLYFILLLICGSLFFSCSSDDDITGTYIISSLEATNCPDPEENIFFDFEANGGCAPVGGTDVCGSGTIQLSDGGDLILSMTITVDGDQETMSMSGTYSTEKGLVTFCDGSNCEDYEFKAIDSRVELEIPDASCTIILIGKK